MPKTKAKPERRLVRLELEPDDHTKLRIAAARRGVSMAEFARIVVQDAARKEGAK